MRTAAERLRPTVGADVDELAEECRGIARPLETEADLEPLIERIGDARFVLLGEASHGTSDFYAWRARLSRRLIEQKGFTFVAVEGDWPDCYRVNRYVKGYADAGESARAVQHEFERWPTWMWGNWEVSAFAEWLRRHNLGADTGRPLPIERRAGFYGLDVYSLWDSLAAVVQYLEGVDGEAARAARQAYQCFEPYGAEGATYARATARFVPESCEAEAVRLLAELRRAEPRFDADGREAGFVAEQNALVVKNAETYYRTMVRGGPASWNVRDHHMVETLERLTRFHGPAAKAIVWEHNTHVGDARYTDMARAGMVNVGQVIRERYGAERYVVLVGFSTHQGTVIAGNEWDAPMERMAVPPGREGTWEDVLHRVDGRNHLYLFTGDESRRFHEARGHRAIGVVYDPEFERYGNYVPTVLPERYDALLSIDRTEALHPLHMAPHDRGEPPETYPWGL